ncbi:Retrovirus-related Pol polyprotein from transposon TNT 1-94 [Nymphaea thermarum]|nr:Retrovirus-related Pol polyprotein from transposon TNT 1-94 [Nymphaea thermarum]
MLMVGVFLSGLDSVYESAKNQMLTSPSIPPIDETYSRLSRIPISAATVPDTTSAMLATRGRGGSFFARGRGGRGRGPPISRPVCQFCHRIGHTMDKCWQKHGRPAFAKQTASTESPEQPKVQHTAPSSELRVDDLLSQLRSFLGDRPQHAPDSTTTTVTTAASASSSGMYSAYTASPTTDTTDWLIDSENPTAKVLGNDEEGTSTEVHEQEKEGEHPMVTEQEDNRMFGQVYSRRRACTDKVINHEEVTPNPNPTSSLDDPSHVQKQDVGREIQTEKEKEDLPIALRKGVRSCTQHPIGNFVSYSRLSTDYKCFVSSLAVVVIPRNAIEAQGDTKWSHAMKEEIEALDRNQTWEVVDIPEAAHLVGSKWVYTVKYKPDGNIERYKARLVAKGFSQKYGIDYLETFAPVAKMKTVRVIISLAVLKGWEMCQLHVKNAFLNGDLEEEVYMCMPPDFEKPEKCCKLKKALYGLKQSPRAWFERLRLVMKKHGYKQGNGDHTLFVKRIESKVTLLLVYVDDMIVTGDDKEETTRLKGLLSTEFDLKDLGKLKYFLGIEIARSDTTLVLSQRKYTLDLLKETGKLGCRPASTPIDAGKKLGSKDG